MKIVNYSDINKMERGDYIVTDGMETQHVLDLIEVKGVDVSRVRGISVKFPMIGIDEKDGEIRGWSNPYQYGLNHRCIKV